MATAASTSCRLIRGKAHLLASSDYSPRRCNADMSRLMNGIGLAKFLCSQRFLFLSPEIQCICILAAKADSSQIRKLE
jgi:hypothetical protein